MFVKEKRTDGSDDIGKNSSRHVGHIASLKNKREEMVKADIYKITKDRVPYTDNEEAYFYLMVQTQLLP